MLQKVEIEKLKLFLEKIGVLNKIDFDIEEVGQPIPFRWGKCKLATVSFGHGITTTPLQLAKGYAIIANGGFEIKPSLIKKMTDEEAIEYLSDLRQIGRWSAEMILLFTFNRSNIWPLQDIGLLRAISNNYDKKYFPPKSFLDKLYKKFTPYCSVATWYLWRSIDNEPIQY